jgi:hypothetical protein
MWCVDALSEDGSGTYTYLVNAPQDADEESVAVCAYAQHGILHREGLVEHLLGETWFAFWKEAVEWTG